MLKKLQELAPWHHKVKLADDLFTTDGNQEQYANPNKNNINVADTEKLKRYLLRFYPNGLSGKRLLDVGCNGGGYCIVASQLDAEFSYGFDPRTHWIRQANFLQEYFQIPTSKLKFEIGNVDDQVAKLENFDITLLWVYYIICPFQLKLWSISV